MPLSFIFKYKSVSFFPIPLQLCNLNPSLSTPQNSHSNCNNSSAVSRRKVLSVFDHFVGLSLKGLNLKRTFSTKLWLQLFVISITLPAQYISEICIKMKINLNFYFHTSLWCLKVFSLHPRSGGKGRGLIVGGGGNVKLWKTTRMLLDIVWP